jgi:hypothetical protein
MIYKIFLKKHLAKNWRFFAKLLLVFFKKNEIITLVFEKSANFFAENWQKSQKILIKTSTPTCVRMLHTFKLGFKRSFLLH